MSKIKEMISKIKKVPKYELIIVLSIIALVTVFSIPTLARYRYRLNIESLMESVENWDGTVADKYKKGTGTQADPYIISNAKEFAYFAEQLTVTDYADTYFKLSNNIVINNGAFNYEDNAITYTLSESTFYLKEYTTDFYDNKELTGTKIASINSFSTMDNFKGYLDGDYHTIYGLYIANETTEDVALFTSIEGTVENLYLENAMIYGGSNTALLAATTNNATIENIFTDGYVISTSAEGTDSYKLSLQDYTNTKTTEELTDTISVALPEKLSISTIKSIKLTGKFTSTIEDQLILINGTETEQDEFELNLGTELLDTIEIEVSDDVESEITLTNLTYEIIYDYSVAAGVIAKAQDTTLTNIINKTNVVSSSDAAGIIGRMTNTSLKNSYNRGNVTATTDASGIASLIKNSTVETVISKVYNAGQLNGTNTNSFLKAITDNTTVTIENSFNTVTTNYSIATVNNDVVLDNVLDINITETNTGIGTGTVDGIILETAEGILTDKDYLSTYLGYYEYVDNEDLKVNVDNIWVYETESLPILYLDDLNNPIATLHVGTHTWNDLAYELNEVRFSDTFAFSIEETESFTPIKEAYYYINKSNKSLTKAEIETIPEEEWILYEDIISMSEEGYYIIYVKALDEDDHATYINSEQLIIDKSAPEVSLKMNDKTWTALKTELSNTNIAEENTLTVEATDVYSEVTSIKYYVSDKLMTEKELDNLGNSIWKDYEDGIKVSARGIYVINIKVEDECEHITYVNSDYIAFRGYEETILTGREGTTTENIGVTDKSTLSYNFVYDSEVTYHEGYTNNLITNTLLPEGTVMTLIDNISKDVYSYTISTSEDDYNYENSCNTEGCTKYATYPLSSFNKIGQTSKVAFDDETFIDSKTKNITIVIDLSNATIDNDLSLTTHLEINDASGSAVLSTLKDTIKQVNIYNDLSHSLSIKMLNTPDAIKYNSDSTTDIELQVDINQPVVNNETVIDTQLENKKLGVAIKLIDEEENIVSKDLLKNIEFKVGDNYYSPNSDGITRINLSSELVSQTTTVTIVTHEANLTLEEGNYNFVITPYVANDGKYTSNLTSEYVNISLLTEEVQNNKNYSFNVLSNAQDKIIYKNAQSVTMNFNIIEQTTFENPIVRVSLYKKNVLSAYDQTYQIIDLQEYATDTLQLVDTNTYLVPANEFSLSLNTTRFEKTGYELRFELYDGDNKITTIKNKFIVR